jgi:hypothetical protein
MNQYLTLRRFHLHARRLDDLHRPLHDQMRTLLPRIYRGIVRIAYDPRRERAANLRFNLLNHLMQLHQRRLLAHREEQHGERVALTHASLALTDALARA